MAKLLVSRRSDHTEDEFVIMKEVENTVNQRMKVCEEVQQEYMSTLKDEEATREERLRLERLKFQSFSGNLRKYPKFKSDFVKYILPAYKTDQAAFVLKSYLNDNVKEQVESLDDINEIWARLDKKYGDEGKHVDAIMADIKEMSKCEDSDVESTLNLINTVERAHRELARLGREQEINNATIVSVIEERLSDEVQKEWIKTATGEQRVEISRNKFPALLKLLLTYRERIEYKCSNIRSCDEFRVNVNLSDSRDPRNSLENTSKQRCWLHQVNGDHPIWRCRLFQSKSPEERVDLTKKRGFKCREEECGLPHHQLLHEAHASGAVFHGRSFAQKREVILQVQEVRCYSRGSNKNKINVLWDGGSTISLITFDAARRLNLSGRSTRLEITKVGGEVSLIESMKYNVTLIDENNRHVRINVLGIDVISNDIAGVHTNDNPELTADNPPTSINRPQVGGRIDCLIGYDYAAFHPVPIKVAGHLLVLHGRLVGGCQPVRKGVFTKRVENAQVCHVQGHLNEFFSIESLGIQCTPRCGSCKCGNCHPGGKDMKLKEEREYRLIEDNLKNDETEKRWEAAYPWIKDPHELPNNRSVVLARLQSTEKRLLKNLEHADTYNRQIQDMIKRGASRIVSTEELNQYRGPIHYISHHAVLKPDSKSTPCRIVFNSSANFHGHVLNEYYAKGPDMLNTLLGVLLRFRENRVALLGDISKMFYAIKIPIRDQMTHLFLWRDLQTDKEPNTYAMTAVNFGDKPSATMAMVALRKTAEKQRQNYPISCKAIIDNSYMDDITDNADNAEEVIQRTREIDIILATGGFKIKEWTISGLEKPGSDGTHPIGELDNEDTEKVLGMKWQFKVDHLLFDINKQSQRLYRFQQTSEPSRFTRREILSVVNGIYDPLGLLSPYTVQAKIMMRKLWTKDRQISWDDPLPENLADEWREFFQVLPELQRISYPRAIKPEKAVGEPTLVIFSDASGTAYGAVAYARWELIDGSFGSRIIVAKNRVAPIRIIDIVRLELIAAVLSKRIRCFIEKETKLKFSKVYHIVDSEIVKAMISKESYGFNTFAANRIGEIQHSTSPSEWFWVKGSLNIADWITRGKHPKDLDRKSIWQTRPRFLSRCVDNWPVQSTTTIKELPECPKISFVAVSDGQFVETLAERIDIERFSKLELLRNTTARILRLYKRFLSTNQGREIGKGELTIKDRQYADNFWIKEAQRTIEDEVKKGKYIKLCPKYEDEILVVGGRTERWMEATWNKQKFILLPGNHRLSYLIASTEHRLSGHLGISATISRIRSHYWIIGVRALVKGMLSRCVICIRKRKEKSLQVMSSLPVERLRPSPPFSSTSLDFFGPYLIRGEVQKRVRGKCYGVIMTCMVSRAVYIDLSHDYSTDAFLQVLRRFSSLRGWPHRIYSDPGSQLVGASNELKTAIQGMSQSSIQRYGLKYNTTWRFSPADGPWFNGVTEALVKSVKRVLNATIGEQIMTFSELQTVMFEVAQILNQQPIGSHPTTPDDGSYLCPNDLIIGRASNKSPQGPFKERISNKHRLDFIEAVVNSFWKKWSRDVFPTWSCNPNGMLRGVTCKR
ncbi:uncharacterized protein LOC130623195 [Hydractinia symbiolongicarpus]|uniref:uncharacterized protein LOC130623195 n=1 Tax=Hydractinia symbiolongicarpus TaxID=13093 RepID=UPI00254E7EB1|nr:uncharacterized protein LOC130623195 [Hydractinia symbiolongicarpus]